MKKLQTFLAIGTAMLLAAGSTPPAAAYATVTLQCSIFAPNQVVVGVDFNHLINVPPSCAVGSPCAQCISDLEKATFTIENSFSVENASDGYAGPYFLLKR